MEGYMAAVFDNFQAGKNAKSSLVKGEVSFFFWISYKSRYLWYSSHMCGAFVFFLYLSYRLLAGRGYRFVPEQEILE